MNDRAMVNHLLCTQGTTSDVVWWIGEKHRPLQVVRPCRCRCEDRDGHRGVGYITGSNARGHGFTLWLKDERVFRLAQELVEALSAAALSRAGW